MLRKISSSSSRSLSAQGVRYVIVASRYNARFVASMLRAAQAELTSSGAASVEVVRVPGAFEIPVAAARAARLGEDRLSGILCLGVILRGATVHAQLIAESVTRSLAELQVRFEIPVIHEVLLLENAAQAAERCLDPLRNRGREAALTAIDMARLFRMWPGKP